MKSKDTQLLEEAYGQVVGRLHFSVRTDRPNVFYSNRTINVQGKEVLVRQEWDNDEDSEWYYLSLVDPETKEVAIRMGTDEIQKLLKGQ